MNPLETDSDRQLAIRAFASGCYSGKIKIANYAPLTIYLNGDHVKVLYKKLPKTKAEPHYNIYGNKDGYDYSYSVFDAQLYVEWLIMVVRGTEKVEESILAEAFNQLDKFILILRNEIQASKEIMLAKPYDWLSRLEQFENDISSQLFVQMREINESIERRDNAIEGYDEKIEKLIDLLDNKASELEIKALNIEELIEKQKVAHGSQTSDIANMLQEILVWMKKYGSILDRIEKDYGVMIPSQGKRR